MVMYDTVIPSIDPARIFYVVREETTYTYDRDDNNNNDNSSQTSRFQF
jgi:hypothetical protein